MKTLLFKFFTWSLIQISRYCLYVRDRRSDLVQKQVDEVNRLLRENLAYYEVVDGVLTLKMR